VEGSKHTLLSKKGHPHILTIPRHKGDLARGTVHSLIEGSGLTREEFLGLL